MAITAVLEAMNLPQQKEVHPFFDKSRRDTSKGKISAPVTTIEDSLQHAVEDAAQSSNGQTIEPDPLESTGNDSVIEKKGKKRGRKPKIKHDNDPENVTATQSVSSVKNVSAPEQLSDPTVPVIERMKDAANETLHDSKRRRLTPPQELGSWFEQLQREAKVKSERQSEIKKLSTQAEGKVANAGDADASNNLDTVVGPSSEQMNEITIEDRPVPISSDPCIIELDGAITSRNNPELPFEGNNVLRLNERIKSILSKPSTIGDAKPVTLIASEPVSHVVQASEPAKATHPFFLGKSTFSNIPKTQPSYQPANQSTSNHPPTPLKSFTTPGKLRTHMLSNIKDGLRGDDQVSFSRPSRMFRLPGTVDPAWPPRDFQRVVPLPTRPNLPSNRLAPVKHRKEKNLGQIIQQQDQIFRQTSKHVNTQTAAAHVDSSRHLPKRLLLTGQNIQSHMIKELSGNLFESISSETKSDRNRTHPAVKNLLRILPNYTSPYDNGAGESQAWATKHAPQSAQQVLQDGTETFALRDWLSMHTVANVEGKLIDAGTVSKSSKPALPRDKKTRQRAKRNRQDGLGDFIVASDEECSEMLPLHGEGNRYSANAGQYSESVIRDHQDTSGKHANAVLISGPNGCGKSAAVFAVAKELGFEVFEINPGSRRSGKDIMEKVGNMTLNHQVRKIDSGAASANLSDIDDSLPIEPDEQQPTLASFFAAKGLGKAVKKQQSKALRQVEERLAKASRHKQSLILLEEVDILYDEDKQFWETVLDLAHHSKRPLILTCTDESVVPLTALSLHAILRFQAPPCEIAVDYLLLLAAAEGHLLSRDAVDNLYRTRNMDLRASIMELNFWCQMAIGAPRAGIDWFLARWPPGRDRDASGRKLRVTSDQSFSPNMNIFGGSPVSDEDILRVAWRDFSVNPTAVTEEILSRAGDVSHNSLTPHDQYTFLAEFDKSLELASAADVFSLVDLPTSSAYNVIDATEPPLDMKSLADSTLAYPLLDAHIETEWMQIGTQLRVHMHLFIQHYFGSQLRMFNSSIEPEKEFCSVAEAALQNILDVADAEGQRSALSRKDFSAAFDPISEPSTSQSTAANQAALSTSSFDRPLSLVTTDLAPYVRSIVHYDQELEQQRQRLSDLLSHSGAGGRISKRLRTTRASRSALEGGRRANTRRERWFDAKTLDFDTVLETGGKTWPRMLHFEDTTPAGSLESFSRASSTDPLGTE